MVTYNRARYNYEYIRQIFFHANGQKRQENVRRSDFLAAATTGNSHGAIFPLHLTATAKIRRRTAHLAIERRALELDSSAGKAYVFQPQNSGTASLARLVFLTLR